MATKDEEEEEQLRAVALQNAQSIHLARRRAEEELREQSAWLRVTLSSIGDAVISTDAEGRITLMNRVAESLTGWPQAEALGRPLSEVFLIINEQSRQTVENPALQALREGKIVGLANHTILVARDGTEWPIDDSAAPIRNEQGEVAGVVLVFRDITERKREEFAQAERTRLFALRADVSTAMASGQTTPMALEQCCEALVRHLGVAFAGIWTLKDAEQVLESQARAGLNTHLYGPPRRMQVGQFNIGRVASTRKPYLTNAVPNDPNVSAPEWANQEGMIAFAGYPLVVEERVIGVVAVFARCAITEGVLAELAPLADGMAQYIDRRFDQERFRQQAELHRTTLASIGDAVLTTDANGNVTYLNTVAQDLTGWGQGDANGKPLTTVFNIVNEQTDQPIENPVVKVLREGRVAERASHTVLIAKVGTQVPIDHSAAPIKDAEGNVLGSVLIFRNVTEERTADRAQALLGSIVESSDDAIVSKTLDGIVRSWNTGAERLFGYQASEIVGESIVMIIPPDRLEEEQLILERLRRGERLEHFETVRVSKDGRAIPISLTVSPIRNRNGEIIGASKIARDITPQKHSAEERERQLIREQNLRNEAQAANRLKDEFLAMVSHELRTPLNAILGWTTMLGSGKLDQSGFAQAIEVIKRNAKSQAQLIEDLLDVSRIISGKVRLDLKPIALITVIKAAADSVQPAADAKGIQLQIIVDAAEDQVKGDATRLQQVIWNLLSNSIKFTPQGGQITVKLDRTDSMVQIMVTDTGDGISAEFLPFVFDRFKQADGAINNKHGGLGLGLAIARHLVEMHGGTIEADSAGAGLGASFKIRLPLAAVRTTAVAPIASARKPTLAELTAIEAPDLHGIRILVVDDEADEREMLRVVLEKFGAEVTTSSSTTDALNILPVWKPAVMVCDIGMPEEDGYTLIKKVRALSLEEGGNTPAIALTGYVRVEERVRALAAGYQMFVPKPVEVGELATVINTLLGRAERSQVANP